jgi:hypothetical protein
MPSSSYPDPVLLIGGSGVVGSQAARTLRRLQPDLPITIGGRDPARAQAVAAEIGRADAAKIDLDRPGLGLPAGQRHGAVVLFVKDDALHSLRHAQSLRAPYVSISSGLFEIAPEVALHIHRPEAAPILMASHWLAGAATLPAIHFASDLAAVEAIEIAAVLDEEDMGGPAAYVDYERLTAATPNALILRDGKWIWVGGDEAVRRFRGVDGAVIEGRAYSPLDVVSLAAATDARSIRLDLAVGRSASRLRGEAFSTEIIIEIAGRAPDGSIARVRHDIVHPAGQAPLTALGVALAVERLLGLAGGPAPSPGLYLPETLIEPATMVRRMREFGASIRRA